MITNSGQSLDALAYATILSGGSMERTSAAGHVVSWSTGLHFHPECARSCELTEATKVTYLHASLIVWAHKLSHWDCALLSVVFQNGGYICPTRRDYISFNIFSRCRSIVLKVAWLCTELSSSLWKSLLWAIITKLYHSCAIYIILCMRLFLEYISVLTALLIFAFFV